MIKEVFRRTQKPVSELILETMRELGKHYSRLELANSKLEKRDKELFEACSFYLRKGLKARATVYANEISELRKIIATVQNTHLSLEKAILRLETFNAVSPTLENLQGIFGDVKNALGLMANIMPSVMPDIQKLNSTISEVLDTSQFNLASNEPIVIKDEFTEAILQEAANLVEKDLRQKMPEPPLEPVLPEPVKPTKPMIALATDGSEILMGDEGRVMEESSLPAASHEFTKPLSTELVMDYIERNDGNMNVTDCAKELNMSPAEVVRAIEYLSLKGKISVE